MRKNAMGSGFLAIGAAIVAMSVVPIASVQAAGAVTLHQPIGRNFNGYARIPVSWILGTGSQYGRRLNYIVLTGSSRYGQARARLLIDGRPSAAGIQALGRVQTDAYFYLGDSESVIGEDANRLEIEIRGNAYVESLTAEIDDAGFTDGGGVPGDGWHFPAR